MARALPSAEDALRILRAKRTRPPRRPPPTAARVVARAVKGLGLRFDDGAEGLKAHWSEIVGKALSRRTEPGRLMGSRKRGEGGVLELRVDGPSSILIQHQAPEILERVNLYLGAGAVKGLRIVQGPPLRASGQNTRPVRAVRRGVKPPLDAAAEQALNLDLAAFSEGPLKQALKRLGREVLRESRNRLF